VSVRIYVEGGGDQALILRLCRSGFARFFAKCVGAGKQPKVIACGGRQQAFNDFCTALKQHTSDTVLLLVDAEGEVTDSKCWDHLKGRDNWVRPDTAKENSVFLMVQCMESWFLADKQVLVAYYGQGFLINALPKSNNVESVSKTDVAAKLEHACKPTKKGCYHKTQHSFDILASLDPEKVASGSAHAKELIDFLREL